MNLKEARNNLIFGYENVSKFIVSLFNGFKSIITNPGIIYRAFCRLFSFKDNYSTLARDFSLLILVISLSVCFCLISRKLYKTFELKKGLISVKEINNLYVLQTIFTSLQVILAGFVLVENASFDDYSTKLFSTEALFIFLAIALSFALGCLLIRYIIRRYESLYIKYLIVGLLSGVSVSLIFSLFNSIKVFFESSDQD